jgi:uncharacterized membrane protein
MKSLSIVALILIVAGFAVLVLGYSPTNAATNPSKNQTETNETYPVQPEPVIPPGQRGGPNDEKQIPYSVYFLGVEIDFTLFIGIVLIALGLLMLGLEGKV